MTTYAKNMLKDGLRQLDDRVLIQIEAHLAAYLGHARKEHAEHTLEHVNQDWQDPEFVEIHDAMTQVVQGLERIRNVNTSPISNRQH